MISFKALTVGVIVALGGASSTFAADLASVYKAPVRAGAVAYNWSGCYVGAQIGGAWKRINVHETRTNGTTADFPIRTNGVLGGGHAGCNWQTGQFVFGVEGDFEGTNIKGSVFPNADEIRHTINWEGSIRGRVGVAFDRVLIYVTGGAAVAQTELFVCSFCNPLTPALTGSDNGSGTVWGGTVGGGIEYAFVKDWSARVEYRYTAFENLRTSAAVAFRGSSLDTKFTQNAVRLGVSYHFSSAPVVAKY